MKVKTNVKAGDGDGPPRGGGWYLNNHNETCARPRSLSAKTGV